MLFPCSVLHAFDVCCCHREPLRAFAGYLLGCVRSQCIPGNGRSYCCSQVRFITFMTFITSASSLWQVHYCWKLHASRGCATCCVASLQAYMWHPAAGSSSWRTLWTKNVTRLPRSCMRLNGSCSNTNQLPLRSLKLSETGCTQQRLRSLRSRQAVRRDPVSLNNADALN